MVELHQHLLPDLDVVELHQHLLRERAGGGALQRPRPPARAARWRWTTWTPIAGILRWPSSTSTMNTTTPDASATPNTPANATAANTTTSASAPIASASATPNTPDASASAPPANTTTTTPAPIASATPAPRTLRTKVQPNLNKFDFNFHLVCQRLALALTTKPGLVSIGHPAAVEFVRHLRNMHPEHFDPGNGIACEFIPVDGVQARELVEAAYSISRREKTPEERSIVALAKSYPYRVRVDCNLDGNPIHKGDVGRISDYVTRSGGTMPPDLGAIVSQVADSGGLPLVISDGPRILGVVHLQDDGPARLDAAGR